MVIYKFSYKDLFYNKKIKLDLINKLVNAYKLQFPQYAKYINIHEDGNSGFLSPYDQYGYKNRNYIFKEDFSNGLESLELILKEMKYEDKIESQKYTKLNLKTSWVLKPTIGIYLEEPSFVSHEKTIVLINELPVGIYYYKVATISGPGLYSLAKDINVEGINIISTVKNNIKIEFSKVDSVTTYRIYKKEEEDVDWSYYDIDVSTQTGNIFNFTDTALINWTVSDGIYPNEPSKYPSDLTYNGWKKLPEFEYYNESDEYINPSINELDSNVTIDNQNRTVYQLNQKLGLEVMNPNLDSFDFNSKEFRTAVSAGPELELTESYQFKPYFRSRVTNFGTLSSGIYTVRVYVYDGNNFSNYTEKEINVTNDGVSRIELFVSSITKIDGNYLVAIKKDSGSWYLAYNNSIDKERVKEIFISSDITLLPSFSIPTAYDLKIKNDSKFIIIPLSKLYVTKNSTYEDPLWTEKSGNSYNVLKFNPVDIDTTFTKLTSTNGQNSEYYVFNKSDGSLMKIKYNAYGANDEQNEPNIEYVIDSQYYGLDIGLLDNNFLGSRTQSYAKLFIFNDLNSEYYTFIDESNTYANALCFAEALDLYDYNNTNIQIGKIKNSQIIEFRFNPKSLYNQLEELNNFNEIYTASKLKPMLVSTPEVLSSSGSLLTSNLRIWIYCKNNNTYSIPNIFDIIIPSDNSKIDFSFYNINESTFNQYRIYIQENLTSEYYYFDIEKTNSNYIDVEITDLSTYLTTSSLPLITNLFNYCNNDVHLSKSSFIPNDIYDVIILHDGYLPYQKFYLYEDSINYNPPKYVVDNNFELYRIYTGLDNSIVEDFDSINSTNINLDSKILIILKNKEKKMLVFDGDKFTQLYSSLENKMYPEIYTGVNTKADYHSFNTLYFAEIIKEYIDQKMSNSNIIIEEDEKVYFKGIEL